MPSKLGTGVLCAALSLVPLAALASCPNNQFYNAPVGYAAGSSMFHVVVADFNGDGISDVAATDNSGSAVDVLLGVGNGTFHAAASYTVHPGDGNLVVMDLNRDGIMDLAANSSGTDNISVLTGRGDGTFNTEIPYPAGGAPYGIASADFNADGIPDLAAADFTANVVSILIALPAGGYAPPIGYAAGLHPYDLQTADFNHDGIADLVVTNQDSQNLTVFLGHGIEGAGDGTFAAGVTYNVQQYPYSVVVSDFDHDGNADLAVANAGVGTVSILRGHANGTFDTATSQSIGGQPRNLAVGDFDRDGITDLVAADYYGVVSILLGHGTGGVGNGTFANPITFPAGANPTCVAVGDFDADSAADLVVANYLTNHISVLIHGCGAPPPPPPGAAPTLTSIRDVPHDQGGRVFVTWLRSGLDGGASPQVYNYRVWRRIAPATAAARRAGAAPVMMRPMPGPNGTTVTYWEALVTLPAERLEGYGYTAPTTQDSSADGNPYTAFFVTALTNDPNVFYESTVDSGYSVDNIAPAQPGSAAAQAGSGGVALRWSGNREADFNVYRVYRGTTSTFQPGPANLVTANDDTTVVDPQGAASSYYKITAVDLHGNEGIPARVSPGSSTGVPGGGTLVFTLRGLTPNPARAGMFSVSFALPGPGSTRVRVVDLSGRRVLDQALEGLGAGPHTVELGRERPFPDGVYMIQLTHGGRALATKAVVIR